MGKNYQDYLSHNILIELEKNKYSVLTLNGNVSEDTINLIERNIQFYELMSLTNWKVIMTGDLPSELERESWKTLSKSQIDVLKDEFEKNETLTDLTNSIKKDKKDIYSYEQLKNKMITLIIILQTIGLIGISYADFHKQ